MTYQVRLWKVVGEYDRSIDLGVFLHHLRQAYKLYQRNLGHSRAYLPDAFLIPNTGKDIIFGIVTNTRHTKLREFREEFQHFKLVEVNSSAAFEYGSGVNYHSVRSTARALYPETTKAGG